MFNPFGSQPPRPSITAGQWRYALRDVLFILRANGSIREALAWAATGDYSDDFENSGDED
jgi:hypothetical protein